MIETNYQKLDYFNVRKDTQKLNSIVRNFRKEKGAIDYDGIISTIKEVKETKSKVNKTIQHMESEDFDHENLSKMPFNDAQKALNSKNGTTDRSWRHTKNVGKKQDTINRELCACIK